MMMGYEKRSIETTAELLLLLAWFLEEEGEREEMATFWKHHHPSFNSTRQSHLAICLNPIG